ncbi:hypothetical protein HY642_02735 [Candidatus Woesearchaeota archaeon]|nr:hypothetical protein [Candidatus Woesearchaeota archaeon]
MTKIFNFDIGKESYDDKSTYWLGAPLPFTMSGKLDAVINVGIAECPRTHKDLEDCLRTLERHVEEVAKELGAPKEAVALFCNQANALIVDCYSRSTSQMSAAYTIVPRDNCIELTYSNSDAIAKTIQLPKNTPLGTKDEIFRAVRTYGSNVEHAARDWLIGFGQPASQRECNDAVAYAVRNMTRSCYFPSVIKDVEAKLKQGLEKMLAESMRENATNN